MASLFQKLARNQSTTRLITSFKNPILSHPPVLNHLSQLNPTHLTPISPPSQPKTEDPFSHQSLHFYPSFSFGCFLNPISLSGLVQSEIQVDAVSDDSGMMWADSVKKKRKRKMNKHKLKKLRKRLRRKT
ncbi:hypothetical protein DCAR_0312743 [Daucus carota subsp. sativus]|uniref:Small ribosomal subunit protein mS38 n=1 Tax=Daucus carota subsp. sativus TaxID=79200 RepID=A0A166B990_DAUCS|nr:PREDICTED: uncharacterized protein LOC108211619 [Daucus carota subsp. sativus]XP_017238754.1 PREDICTED: uncharacterized protein LOC108211619 [Daucus carota subsp. sativus]WOG93459.1 hypothetical protein DCAR_0312743 [Daucus carota subsp. sativus]